MLNFGLVFETVLAAALCYTPYLDKGLNMYPLKYVYTRSLSIKFHLLKEKEKKKP